MRRHRALRFLHGRSDKHLAGLWVSAGEKVVRLLHMSRRTGVRPMFLPELFENFGHITHEPRSDGRDENFGCRTKLAEKEGRGRTDRRPAEFISHILVSLEARHSTEKTNFKMAPNFFPLRRRSRFFHSPLAGGARASAHAASPSALLSFFHLHLLLLLLLLLA